MRLVGYGRRSVEEEVLRLSGESSIDRALIKLGLLREAPTAGACLSADAWVRGGGETYILKFSITDRGRERVFVLKACVALPIGRTLDSILSDWVRRRELLARTGISVPKLYYVGKGVLLEEWVPFSLLERMRSTHNAHMVFGVGRIGGLLTGLGFCPVHIVSDLRSRGSDVVMIDFGSDLGDHGSGRSDIQPRVQQIVGEFANLGVKLDDRARARLREGADCGLWLASREGNSHQTSEH